MDRVHEKQNAFPRARKGVDTSRFQECDASVNCKVSHFLGQIKEDDNYMAERRMFSKKIVQSARFLKMPMTSQCLYFHLGMQADDDGVVEAEAVRDLPLPRIAAGRPVFRCPAAYIMTRSHRLLSSTVHGDSRA